jgi:mRNA-degrading endonuclease toxin of MazEF toxin-antitoxin module
MYYRGSVFDIRKHPESSRPHASILAHDRPAVIVSNDDDNISMSLSTVAVVPRSTLGEQVSYSFVAEEFRQEWVFSPKGEAGCNKDAVFDCRYVLRVDKINHPSSQAARDSETVGELVHSPRGKLSSQRLQQVDQALIAALKPTSISADEPPVQTGTSSRRHSWRRGSFLKIFVNGDKKAPQLLVIISNDEVRFRTTPNFSAYPNLATICYLDELPEDRPDPSGLTVVRLEVDFREKRYVAFDWKIRTINLAKEKPVAQLNGCGRVLRFREDQMSKIADGVFRSLGVKTK